MRENVKLTAAETVAVNAAWNWIEHLCEQHHSDSYALAAALKLENQGSDKMPLIQRKALLCNWFADGIAAERNEYRLSRLHALRPAAVTLMLMGAYYQDKVSAAEWDMFDASRKSYDAAFQRYLAANR